MNLFQNRYLKSLVIIEIINLLIIWLLWLKKIQNIEQIFNPLANEIFFILPANIAVPLIISIIFTINLLLAMYAFGKEILTSYFLLLATLFCQILILILTYYYINLS